MRRFLWKWHGLLGLIVAVPLFIIALSGSLLVFKAELDAWLSLNRCWPAPIPGWASDNC